MSSERGIALILVILITTFLSALGIGVMLAVFMDRLATGNIAGSVAMLYAAEAAVELAAQDLAQSPDWNEVLSGGQPGRFTDGAPAGIRRGPGGDTIDLTVATNLLNCGRSATCTPSEMNVTTRDRPWGTNNPRWRLFAYGPMHSFAALHRPAPCYVAVWVGDDSREQDGDPLTDSASDAEGHGIVRVHAEAYGHGGMRRSIEAELARICPAGAEAPCLPGIRVQSWQELH